MHGQAVRAGLGDRAHRGGPRDRDVIIPVILAVVFVILGLLLQANVAPLMLIATVVLSFDASLGVSALFFDHVFGSVALTPPSRCSCSRSSPNSASITTSS